MKQKLDGTFMEAGVDWITVTAREPEKVEKLRQIAYALIDCELHSGNIGRPWFQSGYTGVLCGHVQFGDRPDGCILRLGGVVAASHWTRLLDHCDNVTRIDLQVTFKSKEEPAIVIHRHYKEIQRFRRNQKRPPRLAKIMDDDGGYTVYTGRRVSNVFGRIYDKAVETGLEIYKNCVRYEVQFNGDRAKWVAFATRTGSFSRKDIAAAVLAFFQDRGAALRSLLSLLRDAVTIVTSYHRSKKPDLVRKLEWIARSVRPSVLHLIGRGFREGVLTALGLQLPLFPVPITSG